jgi:hypothetical protein
MDRGLNLSGGGAHAIVYIYEKRKRISHPALALATDVVQIWQASTERRPDKCVFLRVR